MNINLFQICCVFGVIMPIISVIARLLIGAAVGPQMAIRGILFFLCMAVLGYASNGGKSLILRWVNWSRKKRIHFLISPLFLLAIGSLLNPYDITYSAAHLTKIVAMCIVSYAACLWVLWVVGWDHSSPDIEKMDWFGKPKDPGDEK